MGAKQNEIFLQKLISEIEELLKPFDLKLDYQKGKPWAAVVLPDGYKVWFGSLNEVFFFMRTIHEHMEKLNGNGKKDCEEEKTFKEECNDSKSV